VGEAIANALAASMENMNDGWDEYVFAVSISRQLTDATQVTLYGEYTFDDAHLMSQNGTDIKAEIGARVNVAF
jgi:hypothetical protein